MSYGIDISIDELVTLLNTYLWTTNTRSFYGRVFRNEVKTDFSVKIQPLYYTGINPIEVLKDSKKDAQCFVDVLPVRKITREIKEADARLMFMVNLATLYPALSRTEATEQVILDVETLILSSRFEFSQLVSGYDAFSDYQWSEDALSDLQGHYLFRFDLKIIYVN